MLSSKLPQKVALMQPSFLPWIGYFELIAVADTFIFLDDFQFTKRSWAQRNRLFFPNKQAGFISFPISHCGQQNISFCDIPFHMDSLFLKKLKKTLLLSYGQSPYYNRVFSCLMNTFESNFKNYADFLISLTTSIAQYTGINYHFLRSSSLTYDRTKKRSESLISILECANAHIYLSAHGSFLYMKEDSFFEKYQGKILFQNHIPQIYPQIHSPYQFIPYLSIVDAMFNAPLPYNSFLYGTKEWLTPQKMEKLHE